eukprot:scaffold126097_cov29-Tisochrysis_lutea.AAC.2
MCCCWGGSSSPSLGLGVTIRARGPRPVDGLPRAEVRLDRSIWSMIRVCNACRSAWNEQREHVYSAPPTPSSTCGCSQQSTIESLDIGEDQSPRWTRGGSGVSASLSTSCSRRSGSRGVWGRRARVPLASNFPPRYTPGADGSSVSIHCGAMLSSCSILAMATIDSGSLSSAAASRPAASAAASAETWIGSSTSLWVHRAAARPLAVGAVGAKRVRAGKPRESGAPASAALCPPSGGLRAAAAGSRRRRRRSRRSRGSAPLDEGPASAGLRG